MIRVDNYDETRKKYNVTFEVENSLQLLKEVGAIVRACYRYCIDKYGKDEAKIWMRTATNKQMYYVDVDIADLMEEQNEL